MPEISLTHFPLVPVSMSEKSEKSFQIHAKESAVPLSKPFFQSTVFLVVNSFLPLGAQDKRLFGQRGSKRYI